MNDDVGEPRSAEAPALGLLLIETVRVAGGMISIASKVALHALESSIARDARLPSHVQEKDPPAKLRAQADGLNWRMLKKNIPFRSQIDAAIGILTRRIDDEQARSEAAADRFITALVTDISDGILNRMDLTDIAIQRVDVDRLIQEADIEAVLQRVDLDEVASHLDIQAIVDRLDLVGIARNLIEELELTEIIRESTGALAVESIEQLRFQGVRADRVVSRALDRIVRKGMARNLAGPNGGTE